MTRTESWRGRVADAAHRVAQITGTGTTGEYYYVPDGQSSVVGLVDAAGTERARYS